MRPAINTTPRLNPAPVGGGGAANPAAMRRLLRQTKQSAQGCLSVAPALVARGRTYPILDRPTPTRKQHGRAKDRPWDSA